jgi:hypothetical protein
MKFEFFYRFNPITFVVAGRNLRIVFHFRIPSQDQIVYMTKGNTYTKDLMLNHTFQVIYKIFTEVEYIEKVTRIIFFFDIEDIRLSINLSMSYV